MTRPTSRGTVVPMTPWEQAYGWLAGRSTMTALPPTGAAVTGLRKVLSEHLRAGPCFIAFSGGRDSSLVLAQALDVARREALPLPVPVTNVFPGDPDASEEGWQQLVLQHVRVQGEQVRPGTDYEVVGPAADTQLRRYGVIWPPAIHSRRSLYRLAGGGTILTGEGGDELLGWHRISPVTQVLRRRRRPLSPTGRAAVEALLPGPLRYRLARRDGSSRSRPWLTAEAADRAAHENAADLANEPLSQRRGTWALLSRRAWQVGVHNMSVVAADHGCRIAHPLMHPRVVAAMAATGGVLGWDSRAAATRYLADGLLPEALITRTDKATFNAAVMGPDVLAFARRWDGTGVPQQWVDVERLRQEWLSPRPHPASLALLQAAWLATA